MRRRLNGLLQPSRWGEREGGRWWVLCRNPIWRQSQQKSVGRTVIDSVSLGDGMALARSGIRWLYIICIKSAATIRTLGPTEWHSERNRRRLVLQRIIVLLVIRRGWPMLLEIVNNIIWIKRQIKLKRLLIPIPWNCYPFQLLHKMVKTKDGELSKQSCSIKTSGQLRRIINTSSGNEWMGRLLADDLEVFFRTILISSYFKWIWEFTEKSEREREE